MRFPLCIVSLLLVSTTGCGTGVNIWKAVENDDLVAIASYARSGGDLDAGATLYAKTPLVHAFKLGKKDSYETLLDVGANPNTLLSDGMSVLHYAATDSDSFWIEKALAAKGDPNLVNTNASQAKQGSLMWYAIGARRIDNVKILLDKGADLNAYIHHQYTALSYAFELPDFDIALFLLQKNADYLKPSHQYSSAIYCLQSKLRLSKIGSYPDKRKEIAQIVELLKADGFDPEKAIWDGATNSWKQP